MASFFAVKISTNEMEAKPTSKHSADSSPSGGSETTVKVSLKAEEMRKHHCCCITEQHTEVYQQRYFFYILYITVLITFSLMFKTA